MKRTLFITGLILLTTLVQAQYPEDALRFSQIYWQGTARNMAVGSTFGALGGDFSVLSINPGGMGVYRSNDLSVSPEVFSRKVSSTYNGVSTDASKTMFDLSNFGYVMTKEIGKGGRGWKYYQVGVGMNRLNNYNANVFMQGPSGGSSKLDVYKEQADGVNYKVIEDEYGQYAFDLSPAWWTFLLDTIPGYTDLYYIPLDSGGVLQTQQMNIKGSNNEFLVAGSANFDDILYIGATLGLPYLRYYRESLYTETDPGNLHGNLNSWSLTENLATTGWGINLKIGVLVRPTDWVRLGVAFHTPTYYFSMKDVWSTYTYADYGGIDQYGAESPVGEYKYKLTTPMRIIGDFAFMVKEIGFISAEYEYADYKKAKFNSSGYKYAAENDEIKTYYRATHNFRIGTEWRLAKLSLRAGYALYSSPYTDNLNDGSRQSISGGIGYRMEKYAIDFSYVYSTMKEDYYFYSTENFQTNPVENTIVDNNFVLTFRYFFTK